MILNKKTIKGMDKIMALRHIKSITKEKYSLVKMVEIYHKIISGEIVNIK